jgi:hypothetical protein
MVAGLAVTVGLVFSPLNVGLAKGLDATACGLSTAMIGFFGAPTGLFPSPPAPPAALQSHHPL